MRELVSLSLEQQILLNCGFRRTDIVLEPMLDSQLEFCSEMHMAATF